MDGTTDSEPSAGRTDLVNWAAVTAACEAIARSAWGPAESVVEPLTRQLLAPLILLEELAILASRAAVGDKAATAELQRLACWLVQSRPSSHGLFAVLGRPTEQGICCGQSLNSSRVEPKTIGLSGKDVFDESGLAGLVLTLEAVATTATTFARTEVLDAFAYLLRRSSPAVHLARAFHATDGRGLAAELRRLATDGEIPLLASYSESTPPDVLWNFRAAGPMIPGSEYDFDDLGRPPEVTPVIDVIGGLRPPPGLDRDYWYPHLPFERVPVMDFPPGYIALLECLRELAKHLEARAALLPPTRPARVVWADGITSIEQSGACVGDIAIIRGTGFAALQSTAVLMLPFHDGCRAVSVPAADWTDTTIKVTLPAGIASGSVGFADASYVAAYDAWAAEQDRLAEDILRLPCAWQNLTTPPFRACPPDNFVNRLRAGSAVIRAITINGLSPTTIVEPGTPLVLDWTVDNAEKVVIECHSGPNFAGAKTLTDPTVPSATVGAFPTNQPDSARYELTATGPCGIAHAVVEARQMKVPSLRIAGIEVTQGIQKFRSTESADNSIPLVASKDTVVRVYVATDNSNGFKYNYGTPGEIEITGELTIDGAKGKIVIEPTALPSGFVPSAYAQIEVPDFARIRCSARNSLNFKIPAALAHGVKTVRARAWTVNELESAPAGEKVRPRSATRCHTMQWFDKRPFRVRYVRVSKPGATTLTDGQARELVLRAFDLLATPPLDIAPARVATWHTGENLNTRDGIETLLGHIDDQHDCTASEQVFPWEDECPDGDGAVWVAITPYSGWGGQAQGHRWFGTSRNTAVVPPEREAIAHELGHTLKLNHVNVGAFPEDQKVFDTLPDGGGVRAEDAFDPHKMTLVLDGLTGFLTIYDFMSYAPAKWVSPTNWKRVFDKF